MYKPYKLVICKNKENADIFVYNEGNLIEQYQEQFENKRLEGNIYYGKVTNVVKGMQSAFINIGTEKNAFIHIHDLIEKDENIEKKENMLDMIVDFFEYPENFIVEGQLNMREALTTKSEIIGKQDYTVLETLQKTASLDINGTQTAKNMEQLVSLLQQMSIQNDSVINCENIGKQVIIEMSDVTLEDETEQGIISNEKDIQNDIENNTNEQQL